MGCPKAINAASLVIICKTLFNATLFRTIRASCCSHDVSFRTILCFTADKPSGVSLQAWSAKLSVGRTVTANISVGRGCHQPHAWIAKARLVYSAYETITVSSSSPPWHVRKLTFVCDHVRRSTDRFDRSRLHETSLRRIGSDAWNVPQCPHAPGHSGACSQCYPTLLVTGNLD